MATPSREQLIEELRNLIGETKTDFHTDIDLGHLLDDAQRMVAAALLTELVPQLLSEQITYTVSGIEQYYVPRNMLRLGDIGLYYSRTEITCRALPVSWFRATQRNKFCIPHADLPFYYVSGGWMVGILPRPTGSNAVCFRYICCPSTTGVSDQYKLPDQAYPAVLYHAAANCRRKEGAWDEAQYFDSLFQQTVGILNGSVEK